MNGSFHISPSLRQPTNNGTVAREFKFLLSAAKAERLQQLAQDSLTLDPYCCSAESEACSGSGSYCVRSIYLDTPQRDILQRSLGFRSNKYRIRRYGRSPTVFLERKSKSRSELTKQRIETDMRQLSILDDCVTNQIVPDNNWFIADMLLYGLQPVCSVEYHRRAYFGDTGRDSERLTLDYNLSSSMSDSARFSDQLWDKSSSLGTDSQDPLRFIVGNQVIVEMKFIDSLPGLFKRWMAELDIAPTKFSKFRTCMHAYTLADAAGGSSC